jgi:hypothetical protein
MRLAHAKPEGTTGTEKEKRAGPECQAGATSKEKTASGSSRQRTPEVLYQE